MLQEAASLTLRCGQGQFLLRPLLGLQMVSFPCAHMVIPLHTPVS
jgi:hypothetical protein